jgi:hypothetical protein
MEMGSGCTDGVVDKLLGTGFANAMRTGFIVKLLGTGLTGVGAMELLGATGLRHRASSTSAALSNRAGSCSVVASDTVQVVGGGVRFRTSLWVSSTCSHSPVSRNSTSRSVTPSPLSVLPSRPFSLSTPGSSLSCCSFAVFEFVVVVVSSVFCWAQEGIGVAVGAHLASVWTCTDAVAAVTHRASVT